MQLDETALVRPPYLRTTSELSVRASSVLPFSAEITWPDEKSSHQATV